MNIPGSHLPTNRISLLSALRTWWREQPKSTTERLLRLAGVMREFFRDSLPDRKRQRFGDAEYDWDCRVDTTSANVSWKARFIGLLNSSYQPIEPEIFRAMLQALPIDFSQFTFIDVGSGKGRALLLASEFRFRRIVGVELLRELHRVAQENLAKFAARGSMPSMESVCGDATEFEFPGEPLVVFFFHPLMEVKFRQVLANLQSSLTQHPRPLFVVYANPVFEMLLAADPRMRKVTGTHQWVIYAASSPFAVSKF